MSYFLPTLALRNAPLTQLSPTQVAGANAWYKPLKFFVSISIFAWTMGWYLGYLGPRPAVSVYTWVVIGALAFELAYITWQAARGQRSHFNVSSPFHAAMFGAMGAVIVLMTLWTAYIGLLFFQALLPGLPPAYVWAIRLGIGLFVVFALEGGLMGSRLAHTVGGPDGGPGLPVLNWSTRHGDLRVAHFVGMHALQVLPLLAWYGRLSVRGTGLVALLYGGLAVAVLMLALQGRPLGRSALAVAPARPAS